MATADSPDEIHEYVLEDDRKLPKDKQTVWLFKPLLADRYAAALDKVYMTQQGRRRNEPQRSFYRVGEHELKTLLGGLAGVRNFPDKSGKHVDYPVDGSSSEKIFFISRLRPAWRKELVEAISGDSVYSEDDLSDSDSPSVSL